MKKFRKYYYKKERIEVNKQNKYGYTALMGASINGHKEIVQMLFQEKKIQINQQDDHGSTALMWASGNGHKDIVEMLETKEKETKY
jgi:ankyrin repeat protein